MVQVQTNADVTAGRGEQGVGALLEDGRPGRCGPGELAVAWYHAKSVGLDYAKSIETTRSRPRAPGSARRPRRDDERPHVDRRLRHPRREGHVKAMGQLIAIVGSGDMKLSDLNDASAPASSSG
jgi:hypothetical protein